MKLKKLLAGVLTGALVLTLVNTNVGVAAGEVSMGDVNCSGWWTDFTDGIEISEDTQVEITGVTTNLSENNWDNMIFILFSGDGTINGTDYVEYFVGRADVYGWGTATYEVTSYPADWDAWLAATQEGADFTITVTYTDGTITMTSSCEGAEYTATYTVEDSSLSYYIALSGELCELTDMSYTVTSLLDESTEAEETESTEEASEDSESTEDTEATTEEGTETATEEVTETTTEEDSESTSGQVIDGSTGWNTSDGDDYLISETSVTVVFENQPFVRDTNNWSNFVFETVSSASADGMTMRADAYGWTYGDGVNTPTYEVTVSWDWNDFQTICQENTEVTLTAVKTSDNEVTFTVVFGDDAATEVYTVTYPDGVPDDLYFHVGADGAIVTIVSVTYGSESESEETSETESEEETETATEEVTEESTATEEVTETTTEEATETTTEEASEDSESTETATEEATETTTEEATETATEEVTETTTEETTETTTEETTEESTEEDGSIAIADLTCGSWWTSFSDSIALENDTQVVITGVTTNLSTNNWNNMLYILFSGDGTVNGTDYVEYFVGRADDYGWGTATYEVTSYPADWDAWLAATQEGADFTVTATYTDGVITITSSCESAVYTATYTVADSSLDYYIALGGEYCELTDLCYKVTSLASETESETASESESETEAAESTEGTSEATESTESEATEDVTEATESTEAEVTESTEEASEATESTEAEATESTEDVSEDTESTEAGDTEMEESDATSIADLTCVGWWAAFTEGIAIADDTQVVISGVTTNNSTANWDNMIYVLYSGNNTVGNDGYVEHFVGRADNYGWSGDYNTAVGLPGGMTYTPVSTPADDDAWAAWLAATQAGEEFTITATYKDGIISVETVCGDVDYIVTYAVTDDQDYYIALGGEDCTLTDLTYTVTSLATEDTSETEDTETEDTEAETTEAVDTETEDTEAETTEAVDTETENTETEATESEDGGTVSGTSDDVTISDAFSVHTGEVTLSGDFELTYKFHNVGDLSDGGYTWNNYIVEMHTADAVSTTNEGMYVFLDVRADNYGWWAYVADGTEDIQFTSTDVPEDDDAWAAWLEAMQEGVDVTVNIVRSGNMVTITFTAAGYTFVAVATTEDFEDQDLVIYLTGEQCELTNVSYTYKLTGEETTEDESTETEPESEAPSEPESESEAPSETESTEAETTETESTEAEDTETEDTEAEDTETEDTETEDTEAEDTDTEAEDTEAEDTDTEDTEAEDTEEEDTESEETGSTLTTSSSDGTAYYAITIDSADSDSYLIVEVSDASGAYIYADSNGTCYFVSADGEMTEITDYEGDILSLTSGEVYNVTVDYDGTDVVISFYNEDGEIVLAYTIADTGMDDEITTTLSASEDAVITVDEAEVVTETEEDTNSEESTDTESTDTESTGSGDSSNVISTGDSSSTTTGSASPKTGDANPIIPIAVAILGCAAVIFASKKRMA